MNYQIRLIHKSKAVSGIMLLSLFVLFNASVHLPQKVLATILKQLRVFTSLLKKSSLMYQKIPFCWQEDFYLNETL